jgi:hypothetical protein
VLDRPSREERDTGQKLDDLVTGEAGVTRSAFTSLLNDADTLNFVSKGVKQSARSRQGELAPGHAGSVSFATHVDRFRWPDYCGLGSRREAALMHANQCARVN